MLDQGTPQAAGADHGDASVAQLALTLGAKKQSVAVVSCLESGNDWC
jgi:hypothetical protein